MNKTAAASPLPNQPTILRNQPIALRKACPKTRTGGDLIELEPVNAYPTDYQECTEAALEERDNNARPDIANLSDTIDEYDATLSGLSLHIESFVVYDVVLTVCLICLYMKTA